MKDNKAKVDKMKISSVAGLASLSYGQNINSDVKPGEKGSKFNGKMVPIGTPGSLSNPHIIERKNKKGL